MNGRVNSVHWLMFCSIEINVYSAQNYGKCTTLYISKEYKFSRLIWPN